MDGGDLESGDGLFEGERGVPALLCASDGIAASGDGQSSLRSWISGDVTPRFGGCAASMALASRGFCQLNERFVSSESADLFSSTSFLDYEQVSATHLPNTHKTKRAATAVGRQVGVDEEYLDGSERGK